MDLLKTVVIGVTSTTSIRSNYIPKRTSHELFTALLRGTQKSCGWNACMRKGSTTTSKYHHRGSNIHKQYIELF